MTAPTATGSSSSATATSAASTAPASAGRDGLYGPRGWSVRAGVWTILAACRDERRSTLIPASCGHRPGGLIVAGRPQEDYTPFHDLGAGAAQSLLERLPAGQLEDRQNLGPTLGAMLRACAASGGRVRLSGYGIGPQRPDERVTAEALWVADADLLELEVHERHSEHCRCRQLWQIVRSRYDLDAQASPDEVRTIPRNWTHGPQGTWLWWD